MRQNCLTFLGARYVHTPPALTSTLLHQGQKRLISMLFLSFLLLRWLMDMLNLLIIWDKYTEVI
jgi:hypothetical protein